MIQTIIFIILTILKGIVIIISVRRIYINVIVNKDAKQKAFIEFIKMIGLLLMLTIIEFGIAYLLN